MPPGRITKGTALLNGVDILGKKTIGDEDIRGSKVGMIFQDPMTSLNPTMTIGDQVAETLQVHRGFSHSRAFARAIELLELVKIPDAAQRAKQYPFEFSGGMLQRAMIAMAVACGPSLLIADEPTTALDVTIQAQILDMMVDLQRESNMAIILITHDLGVVARMANDVVVMYAGEVVEKGSVEDVYYRSSHPYTLGLKAAMPKNVGALSRRLQLSTAVHLTYLILQMAVDTSPVVRMLCVYVKTIAQKSLGFLLNIMPIAGYIISKRKQKRLWFLKRKNHNDYAYRSSGIDEAFPNWKKQNSPCCR